ncbi:XRE family transcriptional regulator [Actinoplanes sp. CA-015351]|uniref:XRE family transcriptional regulator n=1 Tax=Actinoplanes sp. CA-015351 TaxID=3239897 RepID=UPI003D9763E0
MQALPSFGDQMIRLAEVRGFDRRTLADRSSLPEAAIASVLDGADPTPAVLHGLASVLGLHRSDLYLIAGQQVPADLAPQDRNVRGGIGGLAWSLTYLPRAVADLHELVRSLPQLPRPDGPVAPAPPRHCYPACPGGLVLRLLYNRNLEWTGAAQCLYGLGCGPMLSPSTIGLIGHGRKDLTPDLLAGFGAVLDIAPADLSALTGVDISDLDRRIHPDAGRAAELMWSARRLTAPQLRLVKERAHDIHHERAGELEPRARCNCR